MPFPYWALFWDQFWPQFWEQFWAPFWALQYELKERGPKLVPKLGPKPGPKIATNFANFFKHFSGVQQIFARYGVARVLQLSHFFCARPCLRSATADRLKLPVIASFFASPGTISGSADTLLARSWSVLDCGSNGAVVTRRQVSNKSDCLKFAPFAGLP